MDRGALWAPGHEVTKLDTTEHKDLKESVILTVLEFGLNCFHYDYDSVDSLASCGGLKNTGYTSCSHSNLCKNCHQSDSTFKFQLEG